MEDARSFPDGLLKYDVGVGEPFTEYIAAKFMGSGRYWSEGFICTLLLSGSVSIYLASHTLASIPCFHIPVFISVSDDF